jgi:hypothetical protein
MLQPPDLAADAEGVHEMLQQRLRNLRRILERPEVFLQRPCRRSVVFSGVAKYSMWPQMPQF